MSINSGLSEGIPEFQKFRSDADVAAFVLPELLVVRNVSEKRYKLDVFMSNFWCLLIRGFRFFGVDVF